MRVMIIDSGMPRNRGSSYIHTFIGLDGVQTTEFETKKRNELAQYGVYRVFGVATGLSKNLEGFTVNVNSESYACGYVILATGSMDVLPPVPGLQYAWGKTAHNCAYCDAYGVLDREIFVYAQSEYGVIESIKLKSWSQSITLLTDGSSWLAQKDRVVLAAHSIKVVETPVSHVSYLAIGNLIDFRDGASLPYDGLFLRPKSIPRISLSLDLGCSADSDGYIGVDRFGRSEVQGLYVCGDASGQLFQAIGAAADGNKAARTLHSDHVLKRWS